mgnify:CR=1 FL=1
MKLALCSPIGLFQGASVLLLCSLIGSEPVQATLDMPRSESGAAHTHVLPVFGQQLGFNLPAGWKQAYHEEQAGMFMAEFVPEQEALTQWSALFCVQGFKDMAESISPERFLDAMAETYKSTCDGEVVYQKLGESRWTRWISCDSRLYSHAQYARCDATESQSLCFNSSRGNWLLYGC